MREADSLPRDPVDSVAPRSYYWDDMGAISKLIGSTNTTFAIPRRNYSSSSSFDMYRHDVSGTTTTGNYPAKTTSSSGATSVYESTYYFLTSANRVYKVLYNGDPDLETGAANISGAEPTSEQSGFWHDANYYLKFMYSLTTSEVQNFLTTDFMNLITTTANSA